MGQTVAHIPWGAIVGGVLLILLGVYLSLYQTLTHAVGDVFGKAIVDYSRPEFLHWLRLLGILIVVRGAYLIVTGFVRSSTLAGQMAGIGDQVLSAMAIPLLLWLREHVELIPIFSIRDGQIQVRSPQGSLVGVLRWALNIVIALTVLGIVVAIIRLFVGQSPERTVA